MQFNKWMFAISAPGGVSALASSLDWTSIVSPQAGAGIAAGALLVRTITAALAPAAGQVTAPTGSSIVTRP